MKTITLIGLSTAAMLLTSATVWSLTPPGGSAAASQRSEASPPDAPEAGTAAAGPAASFTSGSTLVLDGRLGHGRLAVDAPGETYLMLEVRGEGAPGASPAAPASLSLVIDRSGSMRGTRLQNAKNAAIAAVDRLRDGDTVSVLTFDTRTQLVVPAQPIGPGSRERIASSIRAIELGGDTCISCGIEDGLRQLDGSGGRLARMILLSDGEATAGVRDVPGFRSIAQRARDRGASITTVGVDVEYDERILAAVAEESNGRHYFVENDAALSRVFEDEAHDLGISIASAAEATIVLGPGVELEQVLDRSFRRSGSSIVVPLGSFSKGETKTVLAKVLVPAGKGASMAIAAVELGWRDTASGATASCAGKLAVDLVADAAKVSAFDPLVEGRLARSETATALALANELFTRGQAGEARAQLDAQRQRVARLAAASAAQPSDAAARGQKEQLDAQLDALRAADEAFTAAAPPGQPPGSRTAQQIRSGKVAVRSSQQRFAPMRL
ncbi:MAG: VWA domain-containing protein [Polyangiaceae bacterium]